MVGLIVEEQYIPVFSEKLKTCEKFLQAKAIAAIAKHPPGRFADVGRGAILTGISELIKSIKSDEGQAHVDELENLIDRGSVLSVKWKNRRTVTLVLSDGTVVQLALKNLYTQEIGVSIDKTLRHTNDVITAVSYAHGVVLFLFEDNRLLIARTYEEGDGEAKERDIPQPEVVINTYADFLPNLAHRKKNKRMAINESKVLFVIWWPATKDEVFPWSPNPQDRANILIFQLFQDQQPEVVSFLKTDHKLLDAAFIPNRNLFSVLEQETDAEGNVVLVEIIYQIGSMTRESETAIPVQSEITCFAYDNSRCRLAFGCCDSSLVIYSQAGRITLYTKPPFMPIAVTWHPDSHILIVVGERGQYQVFDIALSPMLLVDSGESVPSVIKEFGYNAPVDAILWCPWTSSSCDSNLLIRFETGVMIVLRFAFGTFGLVELVNYYVSSNESAEAIKALKSVYWDHEDCLVAMFNIFGSLVRKSHNEVVEYELETLLAVYFVPLHGGDEIIRQKHVKSMRILARKFFMWLLRSSKCKRALQVATSLNEPGLFRKLHRVALTLGDKATASAALAALSPLVSESSGSSDSSYDEASCSSSCTSTGSHSGSCSCSTSCDSRSSSSTSGNENESDEELEKIDPVNHQVVVSDPSSSLAASATALHVLPLENEFDDDAVPTEMIENVRQEILHVQETTAVPASSEIQAIISRNLSRSFNSRSSNATISSSDIQIVHFGEV